jgi:hypothetical protein
MGGTLLQELGHDQVILYFIHKVLRKKGSSELFFIVNPAIGPRIDIHLWNSQKNEFSSAFNTAMAHGGVFVPEYCQRMRLPRKIIQQMNRESRYWDEGWYKRLSFALGKDPKGLIDAVLASLERELGCPFPDIIGIKKPGKITTLAEVQFEGLGQEAMREIEEHCRASKKLGVPYCLVVPKEPVYGRADYRNIPENARLFQFSFTKPVPSLESIEFTGGEM